MDFSMAMAFALYVIKDAHPASKMTYYRFPKEKANYGFSLDTEFKLSDEVNRMCMKWRVQKWDTSTASNQKQ